MIKPNTEMGSFSILILLMAKIALVFSIIVILFSLMSCLFSFLYFEWKKKNGNELIHFQLKEQINQLTMHQLEVKLPEAWLPILGNIQVRLMLKDIHFTKPIFIRSKLNAKWFSFGKGVKATDTIALADIKEYHFSKALIQFNDMLSFFRFTSSVSINESLRNLPQSKSIELEETSPKKTEEEKIRIEELRKVEGEFLNYKKFETSDDVRRIVWKLFAKHKELVVRIPETMDPFASHLYFYASFFNSFSLELYPEFQQEMLNWYKQNVWSVFEVVATKYTEVRYVSDQQQNAQVTSPALVREHITLSNWHQDVDLQDYFKPKYGSVLCIHSFTTPKELSNLLPSCDQQTTIVFIPFSQLFKSQVVLNWVAKLFFKPKPDRLTALKSKWYFHPLKFKLQQQEKELLALLAKQEVNLKVVA